ncbi:SPLA/RYANODINE RECEPTOR (SPRY) DOMAIN PROTEIN [Salix viminalis]|uniref:SPLA/RYANODINE RECEPTOR (SPRY) DOMAIN PROTEIN n=1 Tax=Salix viminalis TaxID=40686 RepID=A0A9Q0SGE5_SALVM|nr:SPLA/RYANODINE RECEPTOR (SPRY) DOMAIN PROTEIN [Salix viminalis]
MLVVLHIWWAVGAVVVASMIFALAVWRCFCFEDRRGIADPLRINGTANLQDGIAKLHQGNLLHQPGQYETRRRGNYYVFRRGVSTRPLFNWADHPALIADAVENGWSRFGFTSYMPSPSTRSSLLGLCAAGDHGRETDTEISWEVCQGSADFMQKESVAKAKEGEKAKLIQEKSNAKANSESLVHVSSNRISKIEELKLAGKDDRQGSAVMLSVGLTVGGSLPLKLPGCYPGSIGFNSNGSLYLDGMELVFESEKAEWARADKVIGCGFDPGKKQVFFTVDGELLHVVHCKSDEFGTPLYPTIAANNNILVLVNFGQSSFSYAHANARRTPNPCFTGPLVKSPTLGYDDSTELFSIGRIDSQWLKQGRPRQRS